jgi:hypothetical protein
VSSGSVVPRLVVLDGRMANATWEIPVGQSMIGRDLETGVVVDDESVSRQHAAVTRERDRVVLNDLGSTNGTWINGRRLSRTQELHAGDTIRLGQVSMTFEFAPPGPAGQVRGFQTVSGAVHTGQGDQHLNGRDTFDQRSYHYPHSNDDDAWDEAFAGKGFGRVLTILGGLISLAGFGLLLYFFYVVFGSDLSDPTGRSPFAVELAPGVPVVAVGFPGFIGGGIIAGIGSGMSKVARKRAERRQGGPEG